MNTATKDLSYFQQQVAERNGLKSFNEIIFGYDPKEDLIQPYFDEAAEAYAQFKFEQGKQEAIKLHNESIASSWEKGFKAGKQEGEAKGKIELTEVEKEKISKINFPVSINQEGYIIEANSNLLDVDLHTLFIKLINGLKEE